MSAGLLFAHVCNDLLRHEKVSSNVRAGHPVQNPPEWLRNIDASTIDEKIDAIEVSHGGLSTTPDHDRRRRQRHRPRGDRRQLAGRTAQDSDGGAAISALDAAYVLEALAGHRQLDPQQENYELRGGEL